MNYKSSTFLKWCHGLLGPGLFLILSLGQSWRAWLQRELWNAFSQENRVREQEKNIGRVIYVSETFQNCKNPTGHIDTLRELWNYHPEELTGISEVSAMTAIPP